MFNKYLIKPKPGDIIDLYSSFSDTAVFTGKAELLEYIDSSDTLYLDYEKMYVSNICLSSLKKKSDAHQESLNKLYEQLNYVFSSSKSKYIKEFKQDITKLCNRKLDSYNKMSLQIDKWEEYSSRSSTLKQLFTSVDRRYLIRYFQQITIKNWTNTLFCLQKWKVKIIAPDSFSKDFITIRKIPVVLQISPEETAREYRLSIYTTYNNKKSKYK